MIGGRLSGWLTSALLVLVSCGGGDDSGTQSCSDNSQCKAPTVCVEHKCAVACKDNSQCSENEFCDNENGICRVGCSADSECSSGQVCRKGDCLSATGDLD